MENTVDNRNIIDSYKNDRLIKWTTELIRQDLHRGLASLCIGGGMGVALAIER